MIRSIFIFFVFSRILFAAFESDLQLKLILAEPGDTIHLESGMFSILGTLSMEGKNNVVIKGSGINGTILDFSCLLYTSPSPRDRTRSRMPSSA